MNITGGYWGQLRLLMVAWLTICFLTFVQLIATEIRFPEIFTGIQILGSPITNFISGLLLISLLIIPTYNRFKRKKESTKYTVFLLAGLVFTILYAPLSNVLFSSVSGSFNDAFRIGLIERELLSKGHYFATYYLMFVTILVAKDYLRDKLNEVSNREKIEKELTQAKLTNLSNQLQPHFLFNALNSISSIIDFRKEAAQDMIADVSDLLRTSLQTDYGKKILIEEEMDILSTYLNIEKKRFEHQLEVNVNIEKEVQSQLILPFILQPLVENAIKHGFSRGISTLTINIEIKRESSFLCILVTNDGRKLYNFMDGIGIKNLKERLENAYRENFHFSLTQRGDWVVNEIKILS